MSVNIEMLYLSTLVDKYVFFMESKLYWTIVEKSQIFESTSTFYRRNEGACWGYCKVVETVRNFHLEMALYVFRLPSVFIGANEKLMWAQ